MPPAVTDGRPARHPRTQWTDHFGTETETEDTDHAADRDIHPQYKYIEREPWYRHSYCDPREGHGVIVYLLIMWGGGAIYQATVRIVPVSRPCAHLHII